MKSNNKVIIIGSGFASLSAACLLAKNGFEVIILEKNNTIGGRARQFEANDFTFDMGPSWYWMPDVFERFYNLFNKKTSDFYDLKRLDPSYRVVWGKNEHWDIPASIEELYTLFESVEKGSSTQLKKFMAEAAYKYAVGIGKFVQMPGKSLFEYIDSQVLQAIFKMHLFTDISSYIKKHFTDSRIVRLLEFPVLFLGERPTHTPALYSLMNYADIALGTWYPLGGMFKIVEAMQQIAVSNGVTIKTNAEVLQIHSANNQVVSVSTAEQTYTCDYIIAGADYHHVDKKLTEHKHQQYTEKYWENRKMAPSSLLYYLGINKKIKHLLHHNLFLMLILDCMPMKFIKILAGLQTHYFMFLHLQKPTQQ